MQRTISAMVGKGSVNHNSRKFKAENVDGERSYLNIDYCNKPIKKSITIYSMKLSKDTTISKREPTEKLQITMKKSVIQSRKSRSTN